MISLQSGSFLGKIEQVYHLEGVRICYTTYRNTGREEIMHSHINPHFSFVLTGNNLEKRKNKELNRCPGRLTFYHSGELHQNIYSDNDISAHLNFELEADFFRQTSLQEADLARVVERNPSAKLLLIKLYKELTVQDDISKTSIESLFLNLVHRNDERVIPNPRWVQRLDELVNERFEEPLSLQMLAYEIGVHPTSISKHFPRYFGTTLGEYIRQLRVDRALQLIKIPGLTLTEISFRCGFSDQSHFIRTFKEYTGFLPKEFRRL